MTGMQLNQGAGWLAGRLLNGIPASIVIACAAWILLRLVGRKNSSMRFAVWFSALLAIGAAPLIGGLNFGNAAVARAAAINASSLWADVLLSVWAVIAGVAILRIGVGLWGLGRLRARHPAVDPATLDPLIQRTLSEFQLSRKVTLAISEELRVPTAIGFLKPMVILPQWALSELSAEELNAILIHELAHLKRWDDMSNLAQKVIRAIFFFNPAIVWIEGRLSIEREMACDEVVLSRTANPLAYARSLVAVAEKSFVRRGLALAQAAVGRLRQTSQRVTKILDARHPAATRVGKSAFAVMSMLAVSAATLSRAPEIISFEEAPQRYAHLTMTASVESPNPGGLIPASFDPRRIESKPVVHPEHSLTARRASARRPRPADSRPLLASLRTQNRLTMQTVFVVLETRDGAMAPQWTLCVWGVTFVNSQPAVVAPAIPARSI